MSPIVIDFPPSVTTYTVSVTSLNDLNDNINAFVAAGWFVSEKYATANSLYGEVKYESVPVPPLSYSQAIIMFGKANVDADIAARGWAPGVHISVNEDSSFVDRYIAVVNRPSPTYPKSVSRGLYAFQAQNATEEVLLNDFLGISPAGPDIDAYLSGLTLAQLTAWRDYWNAQFTSAPVPGTITFVAQKFQQYKDAASGVVPPVIPPTPSGVTITGRVTAGVTGAAIQNAVVDWLGKKVTTDVGGNYVITDGALASGLLRVTAAGFALYEQQISPSVTAINSFNIAMSVFTGSEYKISSQPDLRYDLPAFFAQTFPEAKRMLEPGSPAERNELEKRVGEFIGYAKKGFDDQFAAFDATHSPVLPEESVGWVTALAAAAGTTWALSMAAGTLAEAAGLGQIETVSDWLRNGFVQLGLGAAMGVPIIDTYDIAMRRPFRNFLQSEYRTTIPTMTEQVLFTVREAWPDVRKTWIPTLPSEEQAEENKEMATLNSIWFQPLKRWGAYNGYRDEHIEALWHSHWRLPSTEQLFTMRHRDLINDATLKRMLITNDIHPAWVDRMQKIAFEVPRLVDIRTGFEFGAMDENGFRINLLKRGYDPADIDWVVEASKNVVKRDDFNRVRTQLVNNFVSGYIDKATLRNQLLAQGVYFEVVDLNVQEAELKRDNTLADDYVDAVLDEFQAKRMDETTARGLLSSFIVDPTVLDGKIAIRQVRIRA